MVLPFGLGPPPGINDMCVKAVLDVARAHCPRLRIADFVDDIRLVDASGEHDALAASMTNMLSLLERMGVRFHTKEGKRWRPTRSIPWLGFEVDTRANVVRLEERKVEEGLRPCEEIFGAQLGAVVPARDLLATVSFLNFLHWVIPGGFCHLMSGWDAVNESGVWTCGEPRWRDRKEVEARCGKVDVDMMARDDGHNAWVPNFRFLRTPPWRVRSPGAVCGVAPEWR